MRRQKPFNINVTADGLSVSRASGTSAMYIVISTIFAIFIAIKLASFFPDAQTTFQKLLSPSSNIHLSTANALWNLALIALFAYILLTAIFTLVRSLFRTGESLTANSTTLNVGRIPTWNFHGQWKYETFPVASITQARYGIVKITRSRGGAGLLFQSGAKTVKLFAGLEAPEASQILEALDHLGVGIVRDPSLPMQVEMVNSRRNGKFGWFWS